MSNHVSAVGPLQDRAGAPPDERLWRLPRGASHLLAVLVLSCLAACGGKGGGAGSTDTVPIVTGLSLTPATTLLKVNQSETFTATAMMSSGPAKAVQPEWKSDNVTVLTIQSTGVARGVSNGFATITATHEGKSESRRIRVANDYQGSWTGDYIVRVCSHSGDFRSAEFCDRDEGFWAGDQLPISVTLTQERDTVTGPLALGEIPGTLRGTVDESGQLTATAALMLTVDGSVFTFSVPTFAARADGERLTGSFAVDVTAAGVSGRGHLDADLRSVARTTAITLPARHPRFNSFSSWRELMLAVKGR